MNRVLNFGNVLDKVDAYVSKEKADGSDNDDSYSVTMLQTALLQDKDTKEIAQLIKARQLTAVTTAADADSSPQLVRIDETQSLNEKVLFIDEALPSPSDASEEQIILAEDRLRFLRNLGRALGMRVILAGTATTAVNMTSEYGSGKNPASRGKGHGDKAWAQVEVLSTYSKPFPTAEHKERPLIQTIFAEELSILENPGMNHFIVVLGMALMAKKKFTNVGMLTWLTGAWLDSSHLMPSPFLLKPADLVRGHMFDPAISVAKTTKKADPIYTGLGTTEVLRVRGPLRVHVHRYEAWWSLMYPMSQAIQKRQAFDIVAAADKTIKAEEEANVKKLATTKAKAKNVQKLATVKAKAKRDENEEDAPSTMPNPSKKQKLKKNDEDVLVASYTTDFRGVSGAFSHCVQACLAIEPIMATALSSCHSFTEDKFKGAISEAWNETVFQRTVGAIDGEMNEHAMFAALQLASHGDIYPSTLNVVSMLRKLPSYLLSRAQEPNSPIKTQIRGRLKVLGQSKRKNDGVLSEIAIYKKKTSNPSTDEQGGEKNPAASAHQQDEEKNPAASAPQQGDGENPAASTPPRPKDVFERVDKILFKDIKEEEEDGHGNDEHNEEEDSTADNDNDDDVGGEISGSPTDYRQELLRSKMPWLVPAYSAGALKMKIEEAGKDLFAGANVCGLVPGATSNSFLGDASAYDWKSGGELKWRFEFRARSTSYSVQNCLKDLEAKCEKVRGSKFHAMLIAVTGSQKTEAAMLIEEGMLRLVLVVGNGLT